MCLTKEAKALGLSKTTSKSKKESIIAEASENCIRDGKIQRGGLGAAEIAKDYNELNIKSTRKEIGV